MDKNTLNSLAANQSRFIATNSDLESLLMNAEPTRVQTLNLHHLQLARENPGFRKAIAEADFLTADGWPVVLLARKLGQPVGRVTGSRYVQQLVQSAKSDAKVYPQRIGLLGATSDAGDRFARILADAGRILVYRNHGDSRHWAPDVIANDLIRCRVELLLIAVTPPTSELLANQLAKLGAAPSIMAVGGAVNMATGINAPAPTILAKAGLEWLFRFSQEPRRLFRRYFVSGALTLGTLIPVYLGLQRPTSNRDSSQEQI